jgi:hypothetical protein
MRYNHKKRREIMPQKGTKKVSFKATKIVSKKQKVTFTISNGKEVSFKAKRYVPKSVQVEFYNKDR